MNRAERAPWKPGLTSAPQRRVSPTYKFASSLTIACYLINPANSWRHSAWRIATTILAPDESTVARNYEEESMKQDEYLAEEPRICDVRQLADYFRCDEETIKRRARSGKLPGFKFGKSWHFRWQDINRMIDAAIQAAHPVAA